MDEACGKLRLSGGVVTVVAPVSYVGVLVHASLRK
jgi:hypothetical protein